MRAIEINYYYELKSNRYFSEYEIEEVFTIADESKVELYSTNKKKIKPIEFEEFYYDKLCDYFDDAENIIFSQENKINELQKTIDEWFDKNCPEYFEANLKERVFLKDLIGD